jgi:hypothetical protein
LCQLLGQFIVGWAAILLPACSCPSTTSGPPASATSSSRPWPRPSSSVQTSRCVFFYLAPKRERETSLLAGVSRQANTDVQEQHACLDFMASSAGNVLLLQLHNIDPFPSLNYVYYITSCSDVHQEWKSLTWLSSSVSTDHGTWITLVPQQLIDGTET